MANIKLKPSARDYSGIVHGYTKNSPDYTDCKHVVSDNRSDWVTTDESITCERSGCKN